MHVQERVPVQPKPEALTDGVLVKHTLSGDQQAFELLVRRYHVSLFNFICHYLVGEYDLACDILQQVFLQLYISMPTLHTHKPLKAWLFQVARNRCLDELRRKHAIRFSELEVTTEEDELSPLALLPDPDPLPDEAAEQQDLRQAVCKAIDELPPRFRCVVRLRYAGLAFSEIGKVLQMPEATAKTYFQRARPSLRSALASHWHPSVPS